MGLRRVKQLVPDQPNPPNKTFLMNCSQVVTSSITKNLILQSLAGELFSDTFTIILVLKASNVELWLCRW